jgi:hypothetical protein
MKRHMRDRSKSDLCQGDILYIYEHCGDHVVQSRTRGNKGHFVDPLLKLYHHIPLMFISNDDVPNGHANGTRVLLEKVFLKCSTTTDMIELDGHRLQCVDATSVDYLLCTLESNPSKLFKVQPKTFTCSIKAPLPTSFGITASTLTIDLKVAMTQLPVLVNNATTGHKLQGQTKQNLVISVWSKKRNWNYVALSRVTTRTGLFLVSPLPPNTDFSMSPDLVSMLNTLRNLSPSTD